VKPPNRAKLGKNMQVLIIDFQDHLNNQREIT